MPLLHFHVFEGRDDKALARLLDVTHRVVLDTFHVPERDRYQVVHEYKPGRFVAEDTGLGFGRSDKFLLLQIFTRRHPVEEKTTFYQKLCVELERSCDIPPTDVMVSVVENTDADWSFGIGRAQFLTGELQASAPVDRPLHSLEKLAKPVSMTRLGRSK